MTSVSIVSTLDPWLTYEWATKVKCDVTGQVIRYRGQTQKWMLLHFTGSDDEIDITCHGVPEFSEYRWMKLEDLPHSVVDFKKEVYTSVARHFVPQIRRLQGQGNIVSKFPSSSSAAAGKIVN
jgi:putative (di)nucleoside polyphosphate hydrolase